MSGSVRRATNAGVSPAQWNSFSTVWIPNWKVFFSAYGDDLAYTDHPDQIPDHHKMWVKVFRDSLSDALEFNTRAAHLMYETWNVPDCLKFFAEKVQLAIEGFNTIRTSLRLSIENHDGHASEEQAVFINTDLIAAFVDEDESLINLFAMDVARFLAFDKEPSTNSWDFAGRSYQMGEFCKTLRRRQHPGLVGDDDEPDVADDNNDDDGTPGGGDGSVWLPGGTPNSLLRLCSYFVWAQKYQSGLAYNPTEMRGAWLDEAIALYEQYARSVWLSKGVHRAIKPEWKEKIIGTLDSTWVTKIVGHAKNGADTRPEGVFEVDILSQNSRKNWETYLCKIIQVKKAVATKTSRGKPESETMSSKKARIAQNSTRGGGGDGGVQTTATTGGAAVTPAGGTVSGKGKVSDWLGFDAQDNAIQASIDEERALNTERHGQLLGAVNRLSETLINIFGGGGGVGGGSGYPPTPRQYHHQQQQHQAYSGAPHMVHQQPLTTYQSPVNGGGSMFVTQSSTAAYVSSSSNSPPVQQGGMFMVGNGGGRVQEI